MRDLFDFRVIRIPFKKYGKPISIYPLFDIHYNAENFSRDKWERFLEGVRNNKNDKYFLFGGDILDTFSTTERKVLSVGTADERLHLSSVLKWDRDIARDIEIFSDEVGKLMKDKTLGVFCGNHYHTFNDGTTSDMAVAAKLNATYIGGVGWVVLSLTDGIHSHTVHNFVHHGTSDARMKQSAIVFKCDFFLMGHNHQQALMPTPVILECVMGQGDHDRVTEHTTRAVRCGSFLKSYEAGTHSYPVKTLMPPAVLGCPELIITPMRTDRTVNGKRMESRWVDKEVKF